MMPNPERLIMHVERSSTAQKVRAMIDMAKSEPEMTVRLGDLDADPMLLGVANGVLDLRTGKLLTPSPSLLVTKHCPVPFDPAAKAPILKSIHQTHHAWQTGACKVPSTAGRVHPDRGSNRALLCIPVWPRAQRQNDIRGTAVLATG